MVPVADRLGLQAALERTSGTVTNFLEQLVGEPIDALALHHDILAADTANDLRVADGEPLLHRAATLRGRISGCSYVYAESVIVMSRLPTRFCHRLETSIDPIGRILDEMGIAVTREDFVEPAGFVVSRHNGEMRSGDCLLARAYRIDSGQSPVILITEWFLKTLTPFVLSA